MAYLVVLSHDARKELDKAELAVRQKVIRVFDALSVNPLSGKKLKGEYAGLYAVRAWPYRITYQIFDKKLIILILRIRHRKDVYK